MVRFPHATATEEPGTVSLSHNTLKLLEKIVPVNNGLLSYSIVATPAIPFSTITKYLVDMH